LKIFVTLWIFSKFKLYMPIKKYRGFTHNFFRFTFTLTYEEFCITFSGIWWAKYFIRLKTVQHASHNILKILRCIENPYINIQLTLHVCIYGIFFKSNTRIKNRFCRKPIFLIYYLLLFCLLGAFENYWEFYILSFWMRQLNSFSHRKEYWSWKSKHYFLYLSCT